MTSPTSLLIIGRKLSLYRGLFIRLGPAWPTRVRKAGIAVSNKELTNSFLWNDKFDRLEAYARSYGFTCPFDDIGATESLTQKMRELLAADVAKARFMQDPEMHPTAGGLETHTNDPANLVHLQEAFADKFGLPAIIPEPVSPRAPARYLHSEGSLQASDKAVSLIAARGFRLDEADLKRMLASKRSVAYNARTVARSSRLRRLKKCAPTKPPKP